jgi:hypothetical protein
MLGDYDVTMTSLLCSICSNPHKQKTNKKFKVSKKNHKKRTKSFKNPSFDGTISIFQFHYFRRQRNFRGQISSGLMG